MLREIGRGRALANALAVLAILALAGWGLQRVGQRQWAWQETFTVKAEFTSIAGIEVGDRVRVQGIDAGVVQRVAPPEKPGGLVLLGLKIDSRLRHLVRVDARARIATEGVVGAKVIEILPGQPDAVAIEEGGTIQSERQLELSELARDAQLAMKRFDAVTEAAEKSLEHFNEIASTVAKGEGSLGKFVRDDEAYRRIVGMTGRGEKALTEMEENLTALKRTWPLSRYFNERAYFDRERLLFQPGAERNIRSWPIESLFEPGRAALTASGRKTLDGAALGFKQVLKPKSSVVIASYTDDTRDPDLAQILTQEQADAVRKYLVDRHSLDSTGWFGTRKIAAIGFGNQAPRVGPYEITVGPPRRVEVVIFTPQT